MAKPAEVGTTVDPKAFSTIGSICVLADLQKIDVELWVQEIDIAKVAKGQPCLIRLPTFPQATYRGHVNRLLSAADPAKGAVGVRVRLDMPAGDDHLRPEMGAIVQIMDKE